MNDQTNNARPMRLGRAQHMDLSRASDDDLEAAFRALDEYMNSGAASAYTQMKFDDRIADIFDEQDRRAGATIVYVDRLPLEHYYPGTLEASGEDEPEADGLTDEQRAEGRKDAEALRETFAETGLVPGISSAI